MTNPDVSVAMCTYNGEPYLDEQLKSILSQTHEPAEIVICDDCSTDSTLEILNEYSRSSDIDIKIEVNETNVGVEKNFEKAISKCDGDLIAICDQDDIWKRTKIETQLSKLNESGAILACHNSALVTEDKKVYGNLWEAANPPFTPPLSSNSRTNLNELLTRNVVQGATALFDADLRKQFLPIPKSGEYDHWLALVASVVDNICWIDKKLLYYRQHPNQAVGVVPTGRLARLKAAISKDYREQLREVEKWETFYEHFASLSAEELTIDKDTVLRKIGHRRQLARFQLRLYDPKVKRYDKMSSYISTVRRGYYGNLQSGWKFALRDGVASVI